MQIQDRVVVVISKQTGVDIEKIKLTDRLKEDLDSDSLDSIELTLDLEDAFGIHITDEEAEEVKTVGQVIEFITKKLGEKKDR